LSPADCTGAALITHYVHLLQHAEYNSSMVFCCLLCYCLVLTLQMRRRLKEKQDAYDEQWNNGLGSHHPDYDPTAVGPEVVKVRHAHRLPAH
jgi:hypothetical protein